MIDYLDIYDSKAKKYDLLVNREDWKGNLLPAINAICPLKGQKIVELGAGTGRITRQLSPIVSQIVAVDISHHMLSFARDHLSRTFKSTNQFHRWLLLQGDNRCLPVAGNIADVVIAGWTLGHLVGWHHETWRTHLNLALDEIDRISKSGSYSIIIESLGTGNSEPRAPTSALGEFHNWLENDRGYKKTWIRTDYRFDSFPEAYELAAFFFGSEITSQLSKSNPVILPECTGIWFNQKTG